MKKIFSGFCLLILCYFAAPLAVAGVQIEHWTTAQGSRVYFVAAPALPIVDVQVDFAAGSMFDPPGQAGLAALTRATLDLGAGTRDESEIAEQLADEVLSLPMSAYLNESDVLEIARIINRFS